MTTQIVNLDKRTRRTVRLGATLIVATAFPVAALPADSTAVERLAMLRNETASGGIELESRKRPGVLLSVYSAGPEDWENIIDSPIDNPIDGSGK